MSRLVTMNAVVVRVLFSHFLRTDTVPDAVGMLVSFPFSLGQ